MVYMIKRFAQIAMAAAFAVATVGCGSEKCEPIQLALSTEEAAAIVETAGAGTDVETRSGENILQNYDEKFENILGFSGCRVEAEETAPHFCTWKFYTEIDGEERQIAEAFGRFDDSMPAAYSVDLDGDGTDELVCNCVAGDGCRSVWVYRNSGGTVERGCIREDFYDDLGAVNFGLGSISEIYEPEKGFAVAYYAEMPDGDGEPERKTATFKGGVENFEFYPYL